MMIVRMNTKLMLIHLTAVGLLFPEFILAAVPACPPAGYDIAALHDLRQRHFGIADPVKRQTLARNLLPCLGVPDAIVRDRIAYEAYATWRQNKSLDAATWQFVERSLLASLDAGRPDPDGVIKPFALLVLAEAVKADRAVPYLSDEERRALLKAAASYLIELRDYRGFDSDVGWRHGAAHAADLLAQLALSAAFGKVEMDLILAAVAAQIVPADAHFYVYGESERFAAVVAAVASRGVYSAGEWNIWLLKLINPAPFVKWDEAYWSQMGLAKRHDTAYFLLALYAQTSVDEHSAVSQLAPLIVKAMQPLG